MTDEVVGIGEAKFSHAGLDRVVQCTVGEIRACGSFLDRSRDNGVEPCERFYLPLYFRNWRSQTFRQFGRTP
jgi:hypothetical protein